MTKVALSLFAAIILVGCSSQSPKPVIVTVMPQPPQELMVPPPPLQTITESQDD
jgi:PBP1b-binding outer membrane lipoprotein LpoB